MFIVNLFQRLFSQSPKFFRTMQIASAIIALISYGLSYLVDHNFIELGNDQKWSELFGHLTTFFGGTLFASLTGTNKPELMDHKTKQNVLESTEYPYFYWASWGNPLVYKKNGVNLTTPTLLFDLPSIDPDFYIGEDTGGNPVVLSRSEIPLTIANNVVRVSEFFGAAPRPPHK